MYNSTNFDKLRPNQELLLVRYSHAPYPDFIPVSFKCYNKDTDSIEIIYKGDDKKRIKKFPTKKAEYRLFIDKLEMAKSLIGCFARRELSLEDEFKDLVEQSQDERPEIWV